MNHYDEVDYDEIRAQQEALEDERRAEADEPIVDIVDVVPRSIVVHRTDLRVGDTVFDVYGGRYRVKTVRQWKAHTTATRDDGESFVLVDDDTITIVR